jgi:cupin fold WbuC family metalloprotein
LESFHIIEGELSVVLFDDDGTVTRCIPMSCTHPGSHLIYRLSPAVWHTVIIHSPFAVIHEVTNGPFTPDGAEFAEWAPAPEQVAEAARYLQHLEELAKRP